MIFGNSPWATVWPGRLCVSIFLLVRKCIFWGKCFFLGGDGTTLNKMVAIEIVFFNHLGILSNTNCYNKNARKQTNRHRISMSVESNGKNLLPIHSTSSYTTLGVQDLTKNGLPDDPCTGFPITMGQSLVDLDFLDTHRLELCGSNLEPFKLRSRNGWKVETQFHTRPRRKSSDIIF